MRANSPSSILTSLILHAFAAAIIVVATLYVTKSDQPPPTIFELVAGPPTAPDELVAPALGNTTVKLDIPADPTPVVQTQPEPVPVVQTQPEPQPEEKAAVQTPPESVIEKPKTKPVEKAKTPPKPKADNSLVKEMKQSQRTSYKEYLKKHPTPKPVASAPATAARKTGTGPRVDATGIAAGVKGGSTSNTRGGGGGKAMTREQADQMSTYISLLIQELKKAHEPPPGVSDRLETKVTFDITASGAILNPRISKSSGDKEFDESVLEAFLRLRSIGPTPNRRPDTWTVTFRMRDDI